MKCQSEVDGADSHSYIWPPLDGVILTQNLCLYFLFISPQSCPSSVSWEHWELAAVVQRRKVNTGQTHHTRTFPSIFQYSIDKNNIVKPCMSWIFFIASVKRTRFRVRLDFGLWQFNNLSIFLIYHQFPLHTSPPEVHLILTRIFFHLMLRCNLWWEDPVSQSCLPGSHFTRENYLLCYSMISSLV